MRTNLLNFSLLGALLPLAHTFTPCPLLGPDFPASTNLPSSKAIQNALTNLTKILDRAKASGNTSYGVPFDKHISFALEIFSMHDLVPTLSKSYPSDSIATNQDGSKTLDSNTTFRIGSLTKLFTVYTFLLEAGDTKWNEPITRYVPELLEAAEALNATENPIDYVAWEDITIGDLASQLADIGRDYAGFGELDGPLNPGFQPSTEGLPPLNASEAPICGGGAECNRQQFFQGFTQRHPVYAPATAPIYSNAAYMILSYALENITGVDFAASVQRSLLHPLSLSNGTSWFEPADNSTAIIPNNSAWSIPLGDETAAGGMYATPSDITTIGRSILSSSLLRLSVTRRWLKPHGLVSDPSTAVGAPWEIYRLQVGPNNRIVDLYTKSGDLPGYSSMLVLIPDWDMGFVVMTAADPTISGAAGATELAVLVSDIVADSFLPAVEVTAREQADVIFSGTYRSSNTTSNSSITLTTDPTLPGLGVTSWISNGVDILGSDIAAPTTRLYPTGLKKVTAEGETVMAFRAVFETPTAAVTTGTFSRGCSSWATVDGTYWGGIAADEFLITVGGDGVSKNVEPRIMREVLERVAGVGGQKGKREVGGGGHWVKREMTAVDEQ